jgi:hypothetical protein
MERSQVLDVMGQLKLYGMKAAYDEIISTAVKRQHEPRDRSSVTCSPRRSARSRRARSSTR